MSAPDQASPTQPAKAGVALRRLSWLAAPLGIFAGLCVLFSFALTGGDPQKLPSALIGRPAPAFAFKALPGLNRDGANVPGFTQADFRRGQVSVINFWASWCAPCATEAPQLVELARRTNVALYGVNYKDDTTAARRFLGRYGNPFTAVGTDGNGRGAIEWGVYGMPETFVVGADGRILLKHVGPISPADLEAELIPAIETAGKGAGK